MTAQEKTKLAEKLNKISALAVRGATAGEKASAVDKLHRLCKKYAIRLTDYVSGLSGELANIDYSKREETQTTENKSKKASRRSLIIKHVVENTWTTATLANYLKTFGYNDIKANKKAVAGTLYDMSKNKGWQVIRHNNGTIEIRK